MKTITKFYNPSKRISKKTAGINLTSLFTWVSVLLVILLFWSGIAVVYKNDYIPDAVTKIEHREKKFLATHKALQKKFIGLRNSIIS